LNGACACEPSAQTSDGPLGLLVGSGLVDFIDYVKRSLLGLVKNSADILANNPDADELDTPDK
jgi:hypothetical protein